MSESFLHYLWQFQYFSKDNLQTTRGEPIVVFQTGFPNTHAGPDFQNCRLKIGAMEWVGSVEVHIYSSGWNDHHHSEDPAYENVVLHVVWQDDKPVVRKDGSLLPTLELKNRVSESIVLKYRKLINGPQVIRCASSITQIDDLLITSMVDKCLATRLENKAKEVLALLHRNKQDWEETSYQLLARNFGFKVNAEPFFQLGRSVPYRTIMKHADKLVQVEALLLGLSGFLDDRFEDGYPVLLQREYQLLSRKFNLGERRMNKAQWKFLRLRPANFPTLRMVQLAAVLHHRRNIFSEVLALESYEELKALFSIATSDYWTHHYHFGSLSKGEVLHLGSASIDAIIINTVVPLLVAWSHYRDEQLFMDRALLILQQLKPESNSVTRQWKALGIRHSSAADSQALLELYNHFCSTRRCLDCTVGSHLVRPT